MILDLKTRFYTIKIDQKTGDKDLIVLCFKHAVKRAFEGQDVEVETDEFDHEGDMRSTWCDDCLKQTGD